MLIIIGYFKINYNINYIDKLSYNVAYAYKQL